MSIQEQEGQVVVSSRKVGEDFNKLHKHVLEKISSLNTEINSDEKSAQLFIPTEYRDNSGKANKEYLITRDGFSLVVMGFTGNKALQWKLKYIEAFNKMEKELQDRKSNNGGNNSILDVIYRNLQSQLVGVQV
ncbi:Rha family transcriptional regulator [Clostridium tyrobutyricum]|nr:Rha family transcriptional regulator [Clostridium tyrobutyricum]MBV4444151.1 Rha family transcriptional regulator [Clostridium tyrobutyricum]